MYSNINFFNDFQKYTDEATFKKCYNNFINTDNEAKALYDSDTFIKRLIINEMMRIMERKEITKAEFVDCYHYIIDRFADSNAKIDFLSISEAIDDWKSDECKQCDWCGAWMLPEIMDTDDDVFYFCDDKCKSDHNINK